MFLEFDVRVVFLFVLDGSTLDVPQPFCGVEEDCLTVRPDPAERLDFFLRQRSRC